MNIKTKLKELQILINNKTSPETFQSKAHEIIELRKKATEGELKRLHELAKLNNIYEKQRNLYDNYKEAKAKSLFRSFAADEIRIPSDISPILESLSKLDRIVPSELNEMPNWNETEKELIVSNIILIVGMISMVPCLYVGTKPSEN